MLSLLNSRLRGCSFHRPPTQCRPPSIPLPLNGTPTDTFVSTVHLFDSVTLTIRPDSSLLVCMPLMTCGSLPTPLTMPVPTLLPPPRKALVSPRQPSVHCTLPTWLHPPSASRKRRSSSSFVCSYLNFPKSSFRTARVSQSSNSNASDRTCAWHHHTFHC